VYRRDVVSDRLDEQQFTATAVLLLAQDGELELTDPISRWITWCPPHWREIAVHHLLSHTSGLGQWWAVPGFEDLSKAWPIDEYLRRLAEIPLLSAPGESFGYSSPGFLLAAKIPDLATQQGTGDIWSTVGDLTRYIRALGAGEPLYQDRLRAMVTAHASADDPRWRMGAMAGTGYGYGMALGTFGRAPIRFHSGDNPGYLSIFVWAPEADLALSVLLASRVPDHGTFLSLL
jgi:CubicO group peptidase (beta-lactamase class C family)